MANEKGKWITTKNGVHILVKDGESVEQAMARQFDDDYDDEFEEEAKNGTGYYADDFDLKEAKTQIDKYKGEVSRDKMLDSIDADDYYKKYSDKEKEELKKYIKETFTPDTNFDKDTINDINKNIDALFYKHKGDKNKVLSELSNIGIEDKDLDYFVNEGENRYNKSQQQNVVSEQKIGDDIRKNKIDIDYGQMNDIVDIIMESNNPKIELQRIIQTLKGASSKSIDNYIASRKGNK